MKWEVELWSEHCKVDHKRTDDMILPAALKWCIAHTFYRVEAQLMAAHPCCTVRTLCCALGYRSCDNTTVKT